MATTFSIGRIGVELQYGGDDFVMEHPRAWGVQNDVVTLSGMQRFSTADAASVFADKIIGLDPAFNPDESVVPIYSATADRMNGYYHVVSSGATIPPGAFGTGGTGHVEWQVSLRRPRAYRTPRIQIPTVYSGLTNTMGCTVYRPLAAVPTNLITRIAPLSAASSATRAARHGSVVVYYPSAFAAIATAGVGTNDWQSNPQAFYESCAYVRNFAGDQIVGRRDSTGGADVFYVGNGLIELTCTASPAVTRWNGASWATAETLYFTPAPTTSTTVFNADSATILKNSPEEVIVRVFGGVVYSGSSAAAACTIDISVRRGDRGVRFYCASDANNGWRMQMSANRASTTTDYGLRTTSAVGGEYLVLTSNIAATRDLVNGWLTNNADAKVMFGFGASSGGTTSAVPDGGDDVGFQLMGVYGETQRVVVG